jgi:hypothetical protein
MSRFTEFSDYIAIGRDQFELTAPLHWEIGKLGSGVVYTVPKGFKFDVSIPKWLQWLLDPRDRRYLIAGAVHDSMLIDRWARNTAGIEFYHGLRAMRVGKFQSFIMSAAVFVWTTA